MYRYNIYIDRYTVYIYVYILVKCIESIHAWNWGLWFWSPTNLRCDSVSGSKTEYFLEHHSCGDPSPSNTFSHDPKKMIKLY
jgi:hypothetical protein